MIRIFYREGAEIRLTQAESKLAGMNRQDVLWIDLISPTGDEKRATESFLGTEIQSRATAEEIESSSRFTEDDKAIYANTNFLSPADDEMLMDPVSFPSTPCSARSRPFRSSSRMASPSSWKSWTSV